MGAPRGKVEADGHLTFQRGALVEHLRNSEQGVEQSWGFDTAPEGHGALRVDISVKGLVHTGTSPQGLHFADTRTGMGVRYGHGTWVDAKGRRTAVPAAYVHGQIQLRVPEEVLASSAYPAVLDPVLSSELIGTDFFVVWSQRDTSSWTSRGTRVTSAGGVSVPGGMRLSWGPGWCSTERTRQWQGGWHPGRGGGLGRRLCLSSVQVRAHPSPGG